MNLLNQKLTCDACPAWIRQTCSSKRCIDYCTFKLASFEYFYMLPPNHTLYSICGRYFLFFSCYFQLCLACVGPAQFFFIKLFPLLKPLAPVCPFVRSTTTLISWVRFLINPRRVSFFPDYKSFAGHMRSFFTAPV